MRLPTSAGRDDIGEKWSDSGYILKAEPIGLVDLLGVMIKKRGSKDGYNAFGLNKWKDKVAINRDGTDCGWRVLRVELCSSPPGNSYAEVLTPSPSECDLIGKRVLQLKLKMRSYRGRVGP